MRPACTVCGRVVFFDPKVAVAVFATRGVGDAAEVLLVLRAHAPAAHTWALPAGFVDPDEPPQAAAAREVLEETGLVVTVGRLAALLHRPDADGLADLVLVYTAQPQGAHMPLQAGDDAADARWFARSALPPAGLHTTRLMLAAWPTYDPA
jgi:ADP-ribose pyrophosphatase YjhB (NUDIX family)